MKIPKCTCGKSPRGYREYYNREAGILWGVAYCEPCRVVTMARESALSWKHFRSLHRWWKPVWRVTCVLLFLAAAGFALESLQVGASWPRRIAGVIAALTPGIYGALEGTGLATRTGARSLGDLKGLLHESDGLRWEG